MQKEELGKMPADSGITWRIAATWTWDSAGENAAIDRRWYNLVSEVQKWTNEKSERINFRLGIPVEKDDCRSPIIG